MRRTRHNVYAKRSTAAYAVVWDLEWHVVKAERLEPDTDLYGAMTAFIDRLKVEGWQPESTHEHGFVFVHRGVERRLVMVTGRDPYGVSRQSFDPFVGQDASRR